MWPSLATANHIADIANWFFIGSLVVGVVSTILIVWMAGVKEAYWEKDRTESAERIASLSVQGDELRKGTAEANARAAKAERETAELQNESQKLRMARALFFSPNKCQEALRGRPTGRVEILWQRGVGDAASLAFALGGCIRAGDEPTSWWKVENAKPVDDLPEGAGPTGITVIGKTASLFIFGRPSDAVVDIMGAALSAALDPVFGSVSAGRDRMLPDDTVRIFIGPKQ